MSTKTVTNIYRNGGSAIVIPSEDGKTSQIIAAGARVEDPAEDVTKSHAWTHARKSGVMQILLGSDAHGAAV